MNQTCKSCNKNMDNPLVFLNALESPAFLMQAEPRQVVTANQTACELFGKNLSQIEKFRGGQAFDCVHSFTLAGCGKDTNCENCTIKKAVIETFTTGKSHHDIQTILDIKKHNETTPYDMHVSTQKIGDFVLVTVDKYEKII